MRRRLVLLLMLAAVSPALAATHSVQTFAGETATPFATPYFSVQDNFQIQWTCPYDLHVTLLGADGSVVTATRGVVRGAISQKKGGIFSIKIDSTYTAKKTPWRLAVIQFDSEAASNASGLDVWNFANAQTAGPGNPWTQPGPAVVDGGATTPPAAPDAAPALPPVKLTTDQARAVVVIKGDNGQGTGFLVKLPDGPCVLTNLHVLSNNPNIRITSNSGGEISVLGLKGAADRDLACLSIKDNGYAYLDLASDVSKFAQVGDQVVTPGNSEGGEVVLDTQGAVMGIGPQKIEFNNPIYHGNSGGPVYDAKSGKVLGVVTEAQKVDVSDSLDKASFSSRNSAITASMRYFGLRLDTVPKWESYDWNRYQNETAFLEQFHHVSECLDSFLNGQASSDSSESDNGTPDAHLYLSSDKLRKARDDYNERIQGADASQRTDAVRNLLFDLIGIADSNMGQIQQANSFYSYDQTLSRDEIDYRKALRKELDSIGNNVERLSRLGRSNN